MWSEVKHIPHWGTLISSWGVLEAGKCGHACFRVAHTQDRVFGQLLQLPSDQPSFWTQWVCVMVTFKKAPCRLIAALLTPEMMLLFYSMTFFDWNVSINICVLFFSIRSSPSHEKHIWVSWITMAIEHVYFQQHPLFLFSLVFLFLVVTQAALPLT